MKNNGFTFRKRVTSFRYAFQGIKHLFTHEPNSWIHAFVMLCVLIAGFVLHIAVSEWLAIVIVIGFVMAAEAFNSAIECLGDAVSEEHNNYIKHAKDLAAGAVLLSAITAAIVGLIIFIPKIVM